MGQIPPPPPHHASGQALSFSVLNMGQQECYLQRKMLKGAPYSKKFPVAISNPLAIFLNFMSSFTAVSYVTNHYAL
jgi:hypothetical protein